MNRRPNILFLMTDQMQARVLEPGHPCLTPNLDRLAARGLRFRRAYTPNAVCSPARASLMTGLLPHNHGVLEVTHVVDDDQCVLRRDKPHWAQRLSQAGYKTGYFGKWHVERSEQLSDFGWQEWGNGAPAARAGGDSGRQLEWRLDNLPGYNTSVFYGVTKQDPLLRPMGRITTQALQFLDRALAGSEPWCCFVSVPEPHDPFICGAEAYARYDVESLPIPPNFADDLAGRPGIYRKVAQVWAHMSDREKREAMACYYASITEIDAQFGRLIDRLEQAGQLDQTIIVFTSDHGELLGAHGLYCKNFSAYEEIYNVPLIMAGPGIAAGTVTSARVGTHELCPTLLELAGAEPIDTGADSRSFANVLANPAERESAYDTGYAEFHGGRWRLTQRVYWEGPWKLVFNGFDFDELYNLDDDPYEMVNLANDPAHADRLRHMMAQVWRRVRATGDRSLWNTQYPAMRVMPYGPLVADAEGGQ